MAASQSNPLEELYRRPGFMIRRVHQIAVALFMAETGKLGVTNRTALARLDLTGPDDLP